MRLLLFSAVSCTLAWLLPWILRDNRKQSFFTSTLSELALGSRGWIFRSLLMLSAAALCLHIVQMPDKFSGAVSMTLLISALIFIFITIKENYAVHTAAGFLFFFTLSAYSAYHYLSWLSLLPLSAFCLLLLQIKLKKGNSLSLLLVIYSSFALLLFG